MNAPARHARNRHDRNSALLQSTARWATTVSTSSRWMSKRKAYGSPANSRTSPLGKSMMIVEVAGAQQAAGHRRRLRSVGAIASSGSHHAFSVRQQVGASAGASCGACSASHGIQSAW